MIACEDTAQVAAEVERIIEQLTARLRQDPRGTLDALHKILEGGGGDDRDRRPFVTGLGSRPQRAHLRRPR